MPDFDPNCRCCPRLADFLSEVRQRYPTYHARPVPAFGFERAELLVVGLAPGLHGANASGRPFTGDYAGILLYETLHRFGFADRPMSEHATDGLALLNCRITNAVKCVPPQNKPLPLEIKTCNTFLTEELGQLRPRVILALGRIAHDAVLKALGLPGKGFAFGHGAEHQLSDRLILLDSYHCSRYNTQTRRLTPEMFQSVFARARALIG